MTAFITLALLAATQAASSPVVVGSTAYDANDVAARGAEMKAEKGAVPGAEAVVDSLVAEALFAEGARQSGAAATAAAKIAVESARTSILAKEHGRREISAKAIPSEAQIRKLFHMTRDQVQLSLVVLPSKEQVQAAADRLRGGGDFALEATRSLHSSAARRGDTGLVARIDLDTALGDAAFAAKEGDFIGPLPLGEGWAFGRVVKKVVAAESEIAKERPMLEAIVRREIALFQRRHLLASQRKSRGVTLDEKWLESLGKRLDLSEAELDHPIGTIDGKAIPYRAIQGDVASMASGAFAGHGFGAAIRVQVAEKLFDELILAAAARDAGVDRIPEVRAAIARAETAALARVEVARVLGSLSSASQEARRKAYDQRLTALRKSVAVKLDMPAARAALEAAR